MTTAASRRSASKTEEGLAYPGVADRAALPVVAAGPSTEHKVEVCDCMIDIVSALFNVSGTELRQAGRTPIGVSRVRQIAMYVSHVVLGLTMTDVGRGFGRDRTTVLHACHLIEDMRDDPEFDRMVAMTERVAKIALCHRRNV